MKTIKEHQSRLVREYKREIKEVDNLFDLRMRMLEERICPACGETTMLGNSYHFDCCNIINDCKFKLSEDEYNLIMNGRKGILKRKIQLCTQK